MLVLVLVAGQLGLTDLCVHQLLHLHNNKIVWCFRVFLGTVNILRSLQLIAEILRPIGNSTFYLHTTNPF